MIAKWREGYDVVYAKRIARDGENFLKLATSRAFYFVQRKLSSIDIPANVSDFRLIDRKVVEAFKAMPERDRFVRAMFSWIGFRQTSVEFHREERFAGQTKYSWGRLTRLAMDGVIGYSDAPLRAVLWLGGAVSVCAMLYGFQVVAKYLIVGTSVEGWSSLAVLISLSSDIRNWSGGDTKNWSTGVIGWPPALPLPRRPRPAR